MKTLAERYAELKISVGGNREKSRYEESFGYTIEERHNITPPGKWQTRILSEIEFSIRLSKINDNKYDALIGKAIDFLRDCIAKEGIISNSNCEEAESMIMELSEKAKEYKLIMAAHAHIDMNWMWGWQETVESTLATFRTMLRLMREYPDFCFSQSQASVYKIAEKYDPDMMKEIKERIKEGRWEVTASAWVETDKNMPDTESLINHIRYTKKYLKEVWDVEPESVNIDFSPDTFGHSANIPEINSFGNIDYYYHCRGLDGDNVLFRWKSPSGKEIYVYREQYWYNGGITPAAGIGLIDISQKCAGLKTGLIVYGVGDHGGGPTRKDIERGIEINEWPVFPALKFGTMKEFFKEAESVREMMPVIEKELNMFAAGCYTTQSRIKLGNRKSEAELNQAQIWSSLASGYFNKKYYGYKFEEAWQGVLFTHFHDILTGSCVQETREHAMGLYSEAMAVANTQKSNAIRWIAERIDTSLIDTDNESIYPMSEGGGTGFGLSGYSGNKSEEYGRGIIRICHLFNPSAYTREDSVQFALWDWPGDTRYMRIRDFSGNDMEFQLSGKPGKEFWCHKYMDILVNAKIPACGYTTLIIDQAEREDYKIYYQGEKRSDKLLNNHILENEYIRAEFDFKDGQIISMVDKKTGKEWIREGNPGGLRYQESEKATSSAWHIGNYINEEIKPSLVRITSICDGNIRKQIQLEYNIKSSYIKVNVWLDRYSKSLKYHINADWNETGRNNTHVPLLIFKIPMRERIDKYLYNIPGGDIYRKPQNIDVPAQSYGAAVSDGRILAVMSDCKYGYRGNDDNIIVTLINSSENPDPYPERGIHNINIAVGFNDNIPSEAERTAYDFTHAINYQSAMSHKGTLPMEQSLFEVKSDSVILISYSVSENGNLLCVFNEVNGRKNDFEIKLNTQIKRAYAVDAHGNRLYEINDLKNNSIFASIQPFSILGIEAEL